MAKKKAGTKKKATKALSTKSSDAEVRALARRRAKLGDERLKVAAFLGHTAAKALVGTQEREDEEDIYYWAAQVADHGKEAAVRAGLALVKLGRDRQAVPAALRRDLDRSAEVAAAWATCPCADHAALAKATSSKLYDSGALEDHEWLGLPVTVIELWETLVDDDACTASGMRLGGAAEELARRTSRAKVQDAVRSALLPWALGEADPTAIDRRRVSALEMEGSAVRIALARERRAKTKKKGRTKPRTMAFGDSGKRLTWSDDDQAWSGKLRIGRQPVDISVLADDADPDEALAAAWPVAKKILAADGAMRRYAARELLKSANEWSEGQPVRQAQFIERMELEGFTVYTDGTAEVFYRDGGLFAGHWIVVNTNEKGRPDDASIGG